MEKESFQIRNALTFRSSFFLFSLAQKPEPIFIGDKAPNFLALDQFEKRVSLKYWLENGPVIVVFTVDNGVRTVTDT